MKRLLVGFALLVVGSVTACEGGDGGAGEWTSLRLADQDEVPTLDPARGYDTASWQFEDLLFETLLDYDDNGLLVGEAAESWQVSDDQRTFTFRIRENRFSNGRVVIADDFVQAIQRLLDPATQSPGRDFFLTIEGAPECQSVHCGLSGVSTRGPDELIFRLARPDPLFLHKVALPFASAIPLEEALRLGPEFARTPTGSGPYRLRRWLPGQSLVLEPNPFYAGVQPPTLQGIVRLTGVTDELAWMKFLAGELDFSTIPPADYPLVRRNPRLAPLVHSITTLRTQYVGLNCSIPPFNNVLVRRALNYATDKEKLVRLLSGRAVAAVGVVPPNLPQYPERPPVYPYDPQRAKKLLEEAGYPHGFESTLWLRNDPTAMRIAQALQQDWHNVGVRVRLRPLAWGVFLEAIREQGRVPMFLLGWEADFPDASNFLDVLFHSRQIGSNNHVEYCNALVDKLLDRAQQVSNLAERTNLLQQAEAIVVAEAPWVFLVHPSTAAIVHSRVEGFRLHPWRPPRIGRVRLRSVTPAPPDVAQHGSLGASEKSVP